MKEIYIYGILLLFFIDAVSFGFILPILMSAKSDEAVIGGIIYGLLLSLINVKTGVYYFKKILKNTKEGKNEEN